MVYTPVLIMSTDEKTNHARSSAPDAARAALHTQDLAPSRDASRRRPGGRL